MWSRRESQDGETRSAPSLTQRKRVAAEDFLLAFTSWIGPLAPGWFAQDKRIKTSVRMSDALQKCYVLKLDVLATHPAFLWRDGNQNVDEPDEPFGEEAPRDRRMPNREESSPAAYTACFAESDWLCSGGFNRKVQRVAVVGEITGRGVGM